VAVRRVALEMQMLGAKPMNYEDFLATVALQLGG